MSAQNFDGKKNYGDPKFHAANPHYMFIAGAVLASLSCFSRADYNLPLFAFLAVMWNQDDVSNHQNLNLNFICPNLE